MALHASPQAARKAARGNPKPLIHRRLVVKAGTNVLTRRGAKLDPEVMASLVAQVVDVRKLGAQVVLVTSGAIAAGREALGLGPESKAVPMRQMLAAVGQSRLMHRYQELLSKHDVTVAQALLTRHDVEERSAARASTGRRRCLDGLKPLGRTRASREGRSERRRRYLAPLDLFSAPLSASTVKRSATFLGAEWLSLPAIRTGQKRLVAPPACS